MFQKENVTAPKSAYIKAGDSQFEIVPEVLGNTVKKKALLQLIGTDLSTGITKIDLEKENLYKLQNTMRRSGCDRCTCQSEYIRQRHNHL